MQCGTESRSPRAPRHVTRHSTAVCHGASLISRVSWRVCVRTAPLDVGAGTFAMGASRVRVSLSHYLIVASRARPSHRHVVCHIETERASSSSRDAFAFAVAVASHAQRGCVSVCVCVRACGYMCVRVRVCVCMSYHMSHVYGVIFDPRNRRSPRVVRQSWRIQGPPHGRAAARARART